jgi:predicted nucleic acid-binding protein
MARRVFVDSSGWYSLLDQRDANHERAVTLVRRLVSGRVPLVTSDYVVDESATLLKSRIGARSALSFFEYLDQATTLEIEWIGSARFDRARVMFAKLADQGHSFTDCTSIVVAAERRIEEVVTSDHHFRISGLRILLG